MYILHVYMYVHHLEKCTCAPFLRDTELKMNSRMSFSKMKEKFPSPLFKQLPFLTKDKEGLKLLFFWGGGVYVYYMHVHVCTQLLDFCCDGHLFSCPCVRLLLLLCVLCLFKGKCVATFVFATK